MSDVPFRTIHEIVKAARLNLNQTSWDYLIGGSDTEATVKRNRLAIDSKALRPKVLNDVSEIDISSSILGRHLSIPVMLAPIGSLEVFSPGGGATAAIAAAEAGILSIASSLCSPTIEEIAAASNAAKIYQLYVRGDEKWVDDIITRVVNSGYDGFCLTVDTSVVSRRDRDIAKRVVPTSQPPDGDFTYQAKLNWADVARIRDKFDIPLILKGINRIEDAIRAAELGIDVIYVSNHGGRQLDQGPGAMDILPGIVNEVGSRASIVVDGGFYRGTDIIKAMALGASAVGLGRLQVWALAAGGAPALVSCMRILKHEIKTALALCGVAGFSELDASFVMDAPVTVAPDVFSAFPLLNLEDEGY
ncbi:MAG: alpha-hydroxy-acid oxidizing enzyme [Gammaproteobacteria bacterium]|jgi:glycolate oxidase|nr:alpha-hydroxy-acid oxidizing enzyme [Gammaproteobacteria bacterium]|tara:strand:- start:1868 stop:2950 length:1083 start_codon:yes stop_codon:yes gene_type:complete